MPIRAKFYCSQVSKFADGGESVQLHAANGKKETANAQWAKWTPGGNLTMTINNPDAQGMFKPGGFYFLDFTEASEDA